MARAVYDNMTPEDRERLDAAIAARSVNPNSMQARMVINEMDQKYGLGTGRNDWVNPAAKIALGFMGAGAAGVGPMAAGGSAGAGTAAGGAAGTSIGAGLGKAALPAALLGSGYMSSQAAKDAAKTQSESAKRAADVQLQMFQEGQAATAPWRQTGEKALGQLESLYGLGSPADREAAYEQFRSTPGYQFQLDEMQRNLAGYTSAMGRSPVGGSALKELQRRSMGIADQSYGNYVQGLGALSNLGAGQAGNFATGSQNLGTNLGNTYMQQGQAEAAGIINQSNVMSNMLTQGAQLYGMGAFSRPQTSLGFQPQQTSMVPDIRFDTGAAVNQYYGLPSVA